METVDRLHEEAHSVYHRATEVFGGLPKAERALRGIETLATAYTFMEQNGYAPAVSLAPRNDLRGTEWSEVFRNAGLHYSDGRIRRGPIIDNLAHHRGETWYPLIISRTYGEPRYFGGNLASEYKSPELQTRDFRASHPELAAAIALGIVTIDQARQLNVRSAKGGLFNSPPRIHLTPYSSQTVVVSSTTLAVQEIAGTPDLTTWPSYTALEQPSPPSYTIQNARLGTSHYQDGVAAVSVHHVSS